MNSKSSDKTEEQTGTCRNCGNPGTLNQIRYCSECSKPRHPGLTRGFRFTHGIWDKRHNVNSRDIARPEIHPTRASAEQSFRDWVHEYYSQGYEIWVHDIKEIPVRSCPVCGHLADMFGDCFYCGSEPEHRNGNKSIQEIAGEILPDVCNAVLIAEKMKRELPKHLNIYYIDTSGQIRVQKNTKGYWTLTDGHDMPSKVKGKTIEELWCLLGLGNYKDSADIHSAPDMGV